MSLITDTLPAEVFGSDLSSEFARAETVILFGSRAVGVADERSDWDLLCIGEGQSRWRADFTLVWKTPEELASSDWAGSELAAHIAAYGRALKGSVRWDTAVGLSDAAIERKRGRVIRRCRALFAHTYRPDTTMELTTRLRRELQRYELLLDGHPVPPRQVLDEAWSVRAAERVCGLPGLDSVRDELRQVMTS